MKTVYYTMYIKRAKDPLSGAEMDMWAVMDATDNRQIAYCPRQADAERIAALLAYHAEMVSQSFVLNNTTGSGGQ